MADNDTDSTSTSSITSSTSMSISPPPPGSAEPYLEWSEHDQCAITLEPLISINPSRRYTLVPCGHTFSRQSLTQHYAGTATVQNPDFDCPVCRGHCTVAQNPMNRSVEVQMNIEQEAITRLRSNTPDIAQNHRTNDSNASSGIIFEHNDPPTSSSSSREAARPVRSSPATSTPTPYSAASPQSMFGRYHAASSSSPPVWRRFPRERSGSNLTHVHARRVENMSPVQPPALDLATSNGTRPHPRRRSIPISEILARARDRQQSTGATLNATSTQTESMEAMVHALTNNTSVLARSMHGIREEIKLVSNDVRVTGSRVFLLCLLGCVIVIAQYVFNHGLMGGTTTALFSGGIITYLYKQLEFTDWMRRVAVR